MKNKKDGHSYVSVIVAIFILLVVIEIGWLCSFVIKNNTEALTKKIYVFQLSNNILHEELFRDSLQNEEKYFYQDNLKFHVVSEMHCNLKKVKVVVFDNNQDIERVVKYRYIGRHSNDESEVVNE